MIQECHHDRNPNVKMGKEGGSWKFEPHEFYPYITLWFALTLMKVENL